MLDKSPDQITELARNDISVRYALVHLNPFAVRGDDGLYQKFNKNMELALYDPQTGKGLTDEYLQARSKRRCRRWECGRFRARFLRKKRTESVLPATAAGLHAVPDDPSPHMALFVVFYWIDGFGSHRAKRNQIVISKAFQYRIFL